MNLVLEIKIDKESRAVAYYIDVTTDFALIETKEIIDNYNKNLSGIFKRKDSTLSALYIIAKEADNAAIWHNILNVTAESYELLSRKYPTEWDSLSTNMRYEFKDRKNVAIDETRMSDFLYDAKDIDDGFITIDFDSKMIFLKKIFDEMSGLSYACRCKINPKNLDMNQFVLLEKPIESLPFNELFDTISILEKHKGWRLESDLNYLHIKRKYKDLILENLE